MNCFPKNSVLMWWRNAMFPSGGLPPAHACCFDQARRDAVAHLSVAENYARDMVVCPSDVEQSVAGVKVLVPPMAHLRRLCSKLATSCGYEPDTLLLQERLCAQIHQDPCRESWALNQSAVEYLQSRLGVRRVVTLDESEWDYSDIAVVRLHPEDRDSTPFATMDMQPLGGIGYGDFCSKCGQPARWRVLPGDPKMGMLLQDFPDFPILGGNLRCRD